MLCHAQFCVVSWTCSNLEVSKKSALVVWSHRNVLLSFLEKLECLSPNFYSFSVEGILNLQGVSAVSRKCFKQKDRNVGGFFFLKLWYNYNIFPFPFIPPNPLNITFSVHRILLLYMSSGLTIWHWTNNWCVCPEEDYLSSSQLSSVTNSSLHRTKALWAIPHPV